MASRDELIRARPLFDWLALSERPIFLSVRPVILAEQQLIALITLLMITSTCSAAPHQPTPAYWVFAWSTRGGAHRYAVVPQAEKHTFLVTFNRSLPGMPTLAELEARLRTLPKGVLIAFGEATCLGITYPPNDVMSRIEQFAAANNISLILIQGACE